mgnify:CR=1 FL=1
MKLSKETLALLKNFAGINSNLLLKDGGKLSTISAQKNIMASASVTESLPSEFGIYDLNEFLGALSLFDDPELTFTDKFVTMKEGAAHIKYYAADKSVLSYPQKDITFPSSDIDFNLPSATLTQIIRTASVLRASERTGRQRQTVHRARQKITRQTQLRDCRSHRRSCRQRHQADGWRGHSQHPLQGRRSGGGGADVGRGRFDVYQLRSGGTADQPWQDTTAGHYRRAAQPTVAQRADDSRRRARGLCGGNVVRSLHARENAAGHHQRRAPGNFAYRSDCRVPRENGSHGPHGRQQHARRVHRKSKIRSRKVPQDHYRFENAAGLITRTHTLEHAKTHKENHVKA